MTLLEKIACSLEALVANSPGGQNEKKGGNGEGDNAGRGEENAQELDGWAE